MSIQGIQTLTIAVAFGVMAWVAMFRLSAKTCRWLCLGLLSCLVVWMIVYRSQQVSLYSDVPVHLAMIENEAESGPFGGDPFFEKYPTPLHYSPLHMIGGWMVGTLGLTVENSWMVLGVFYAAGVFLASLVFGHALFRDERMAWVQAIVTTCWMCLGTSSPGFGPSSFFTILLAMGLILSCAQHQELKWSYVVLISVVVGFGLAVRLYPGSPGYLLVLVLLFAMRPQWSRQQWQAKYVVMVLGPLLLAWPWLSLLIVHAHPGNGGTTTLSWPGWDAYWAIRWLYLKGIWLAAGPGFAQILCLLLGGLGSILLLTSQVVSRTARRFLGWMLGFLVVLWLFPLEVLLASSMSDVQLERMADIFGRFVNLSAPMAMAFGVIAVLKARAEVSGRRWTVWSALALGCLILLGLGPASRLRLRVELGQDVRPRLEFLHRGKPVFDILRGRVVLSDAWTSYLTQHALGSRVVAIPVGHSSEMVDIDYRRHCIGALFAGALPRDSVERLISRYRVDFILVNKVLAGGRSIPNLEVTASEYEHYDPAYLRECGLFKVLFEDNDVLLLAVQHG